MSPEGAFVGSAFYGDVGRAKGLDVTVKVRDLQAKNKTLRADNSLFGDPVVGVRKVLFVDCVFPWFPSATELTRNTVISTLATAEQFELNFDIMPTGRRDDWSNILHFTAHGNWGGEFDRIPAIFVHGKSTRLHVGMGRRGSPNDGVDPSKELPTGKTTRVTVRLQGDELKVFFDGQQVASNSNYHGKVPALPSVQVFASDPWFEASAARVANVWYLPLHSPLAPPPPPPSPKMPMPRRRPICRRLVGTRGVHLRQAGFSKRWI